MTASIAALLSMTAAVAISAPALAQPAAASRTYAIQVGPLGAALNQFGRAAGVAISYDAAVIAGKTTKGVRGTHNTAEALDILLRGTALRATPDGAGGFVIAAAPQATRRERSPRRSAAVAAPASVRHSDADEIVVTGGKFQNSLMNRLPTELRELPFSLDLISEAEIEKRGFFNPLDIIETIPNVARLQTRDMPGGGQYLIRGFNASVLTNNRPESTSRGAGRREMSYIDHIEIGKGPASILLGPVIPGGVINQITKSPQDEDFVEITLRGGSYDTYRAEIDANAGSLLGSDVLSARLTIAYEDQGSPQKPEHTETFAIRPVIEADFSDRTRAQFSVAYTKRDNIRGSGFAVNADGTVPDVITPKTYYGVPSPQKGDDTYFDAEFQHEFLDNLKLVVRGSYQDANFEYNVAQNSYNYTGSSRGFEPGDSMAYVYYARGFRDQNVAYGDVQLVGHFQAFGERQDWVIGSSYTNEKTVSDWGFGGLLGVVDIYDLASATYGTPDFAGITMSPFIRTTSHLYSIYAETNIRPTSRLTIVAGARYDEQKQKDKRRGTERKDDDITFRVGASYALLGGLNGYLSYAESFIPQSGTQRSGETIDPERATNYEIGLKGSMLDGRVRLTAAGFILTRKNVATADPSRVPGEPSYVLPVGEQKHKGFEVSAGIDLSRAFSVDLRYGYVHAEITKNNDGQQGNPVALVPHHTFGAYAAYTVPDGSLAGLKAGLGVRGISSRVAPRYGLNYPGYTLVDASLTYPLSERFSVQLNVHNLLDERYRETLGFDDGRQSTAHRFGQPRSAYVTFRARL